MSVITRFPPSPTGYLHIGGARTALFNWLFARAQSGQMVLRIEDTDLERSTDEAKAVILEAMQWLGLNWDQGPFYQTARFDRYQQVIDELLEKGLAYRCYCSKDRLDALREAQRANGEKPKYDRHCLSSEETHGDDDPYVIRFRQPDVETVGFNDLVRGPIEVNMSELDDLIIARSDGSPTYNLCVVVDDIDMGISHVIRGEDHISNTFKQISIFKALDANVPIFAHIPLIMGTDGGRLSKRHGAVSVLQYRDMGVLPEALLNYLVRLGWSYGDEEFFTIDEMVEKFAIDNVQSSPATFDQDKMLWYSQHYIKTLPLSRIAETLPDYLSEAALVGFNAADADFCDTVIDLVRPRCKTLVELAQQSDYFFTDAVEYDAADAEKFLQPVVVEAMADLKTALNGLENWQSSEIQTLFKQILSTHEMKMPQLALPVRVAVAGVAATPSIDETLFLLGKNRVNTRLDAAIEWIKKNR